MITSIDEFHFLEKKYAIPSEEIISLNLNLTGINSELNFDRIRFTAEINKMYSLLFSLENNKQSFYNIKNNRLFFKEACLFDVNDLQEDDCKIFYTRKNDRVLCFNPNNRSSCEGCCFCYQPKSSDRRSISLDIVKNTLEVWMQQNNLKNLSHLEQVAVVTGCFKTEQITIDYLIKLREILNSFGFREEILFFGIITDIKNIKLLSEIKPLQLCFAIECFENRDSFLLIRKNLELEKIITLMETALKNGIKTTFSYIVGLDSFEIFKKNIILLKDYVNNFPIISIFQTNKKRIKYRHKEASYIEYYLECRRYLETIFNGTNLLPNSWNNYRSLWRTCYNGESILKNV
jgi:hypothetical protein